MGVLTWFRGTRVPALDDDDDERAAGSGPGASAAFLLTTYEPELWDGRVVGTDAAAWEEIPGGDLVMARGDYQRWMQDARGWAKRGLEAAESGDPYREHERVDEALCRAARAVLSAIAADSPHAVVSALWDYVNHARARTPSHDGR